MLLPWPGSVGGWPLNGRVRPGAGHCRSVQRRVILSVTRSEVEKPQVEAETPPTTRRVLPRWYVAILVILALVIIATAVPAFTETMHSPGIEDFFPAPIFGAGTFFSFNRLVLARIIAAVVLCVIFAVGAAHLKLIPSRGQQLLEMGAEFVRNQIGIQVLGEARGKKYSAFLGFVFFGVLAMNLTGIVPGINIAASSVMAIPLVFAVISYVSFIGAGIKKQGVGSFFKSQLFPPGVPKAIYIILTPIEAFSTFVVRPATLAIRLLCNMISGHLLLAMTFFGTSAMLAAIPAMKGLAVLTIASSFVVTLFELFIAVLQAYIFAILTSVYIMLSVENH